MAARIYSAFPEKKISQPSPSKDPSAGPSGSVRVKSTNWPGLPGKASNWYGSKGPKVKKYVSSKGLC